MDPKDIERLVNDGLTDQEIVDSLVMSTPARPGEAECIFDECLAWEEENKAHARYLEVQQVLREARRILEEGTPS